MSDSPTSERLAAPGTHLSRDERLRALLEAASDLIAERGISEVSLSAIATRSGVSRQWLYEFFPDIDSIFAALYQNARDEYLKPNATPPVGLFERIEYLKREIDSYLDLPVACAIVGSYAINGGLRKTGSIRALRESILGNLERGWVEPMVQQGVSREESYASVITLMNTVYGLVTAIDGGLTTRAVAQRRLASVIDAVVIHGLA